MTRISSTFHGSRYSPDAHRTCSKEVTRAEMGASVSMRGLCQISTSVIRPDQKLAILLKMAHTVESAIMDIHFSDNGNFDNGASREDVIYPMLDADSLDGYFDSDSPFVIHEDRLREMRERHVDFGNSLREHTDDE